MGLGLVGCTSLTAVDWTLIPPPEAAPGGSASGGSDAAAGNNDAGGQPAGGQGGVASGAGGEGEGGYAGEVGGAPPDTAGSGGGGMGGVAGVGGGGAASLGGMSGGGAAGTGGGGMAGTGGGATTLCSDYPTGPLATNFTGQIVLFDGGIKPAGDNVPWGGRVGIDNACKQAALALGLTKKTVHALAAAADGMTQAINSNLTGNYAEVFEVPMSAMFVSKFGIAMGMWPEFATNPRKSLICAGVFPADVSAWFSGVTRAGDGDFNNNCKHWTFGEASVETRAFVGRTDTTARVFQEHWLSDHWVTCNSTTTHLLCLAWGD